MNIKKILETRQIEASAPCRIDMGGTLDISTFYYPLRHHYPCTFNMAVDLRTRVRLLPYLNGMVKVSSKGFKDAEYPFNLAPFDHPLGLMFAVAAYFRADGVHIDIDSSSPPRSALGGSSAAAVALVAAFSKVHEKTGESRISKSQIAILAHVLEASVAGVPCGLQDQLAAAYGGVNLWHWPGRIDKAVFRKETIFGKESFEDIEKHLLLAFCGIPHESKNINSIWVRQFLSGESRDVWIEILECTKKFVYALKEKIFEDAAAAMDAEMALRRKMTPEVLDEMGEKLFNLAGENNCGARFTGAGGGGCVWAMGEDEDIVKLKNKWDEVLAERNKSCLLDVKIDSKGVLVIED